MDLFSFCQSRPIIAGIIVYSQKAANLSVFQGRVQGVPYGNARVFWSVKTWVGRCGAASSFGLN